MEGLKIWRKCGGGRRGACDTKKKTGEETQEKIQFGKLGGRGRLIIYTYMHQHNV